MSRKLRTNLPILTSKLEPLLINKQEFIRDLNNFTYKSTDRFNKTAKKYKNVNIGDKVMFKRNPSSFWYPEEITKSSNEPRFYVVRDEEGRMQRRNKEHIRDRNEISTPPDNDLENETNNIQQSPNDRNYIENYNPVQRSNLENNVYTTRAGRNVKPPSRLNL